MRDNLCGIRRIKQWQRLRRTIIVCSPLSAYPYHIRGTVNHFLTPRRFVHTACDTGDTIQLPEFIINSLTSATSIHCVHSRLRLGYAQEYAGRWQTRCARALLTRSTSSADLTRLTSLRTCTGSTMASVPFAAHGYESYFALGLLDR